MQFNLNLVDKAVAQALDSNCQNRHGSILFKGNKILSSANNQNGPGGNHAEVQAIKTHYRLSKLYIQQQA